MTITINVKDVEILTKGLKKLGISYTAVLLPQEPLFEVTIDHPKALLLLDAFNKSLEKRHEKELQANGIIHVIDKWLESKNDKQSS